MERGGRRDDARVDVDGGGGSGCSTTEVAVTVMGEGAGGQVAVEMVPQSSTYEVSGPAAVATVAAAAEVQLERASNALDRRAYMATGTEKKKQERIQGRVCFRRG